MKRVALAVIALILPLPLFAQTQFKNVQQLKSLTPIQLSRTMQMMSASLGTNCAFCHVRKGEELDFASDDKHEKVTARNMMAMTTKINADFFNARPVVSCNSCHRGAEHPVNLVALPVTPNHAAPMEHDEKRPEMPSRDAIVAKYEAALGKVSALSSFTAKGIREPLEGPKSEFELESANGMFRSRSGETVAVITPTGGWTADKAHPAHEMPPVMRESSLDVIQSLRLVMPHDIPAAARVVRKDKVGDREAYVMNANLGDGVRERLYFDAENGLLLRRITYLTTPIGEIPTQTDFSDYREVGGVRVPFTVRLDSVDARQSATRHYTEIHPNAKIDESAFAMPK
jgi:hypothetical protein